MPLQNIDKTTRSRNKRNLSKLVVFPTLVFDEEGDYWKMAQQQHGVWPAEAWRLLEAVPAPAPCQPRGDKSPGAFLAWVLFFIFSLADRSLFHGG